MRSVKTNAILNIARTCVTIFVPLISYPYVSRVLSVDDLGKINFTNSIISYFLLLATLGIPTYAVREAVSLGDKKEKDGFISEIYSMSLFFTFLSYVGLFILYMFWPSIRGYRNLIFIQSLTIGFTTIGSDWVNNIDEDFFFLSIRTLLIQLLSLVATFVFIRSEDNYIHYAMISSFAIVVTNAINYFYIRRKHKIRIVKFRMRIHIVPVLVIFLNTVAVTIYSNSDSTMLGIFRGDYEVGIYNLASKVYAIMKTLFSAIYVAVLPRVVKYLGENDDSRCNELLQKTFHTLTVFLLPSMLGILLLSKNIVFLVGGPKYYESAIPLMILALALLFAMLSNYISTLILIPKKKENKVFFATAVGAGLNVVLNLIFIPFMGALGASITTLIAEIVVSLILFFGTTEKSLLYISKRDLSVLIVGNALVILTVLLTNHYLSSIYVGFFVSMIASVIIYFAVLIVLGESVVANFINRRKQ